MGLGLAGSAQHAQAQTHSTGPPYGHGGLELGSLLVSLVPYFWVGRSHSSCNVIQNLEKNFLTPVWC